MFWILYGVLRSLIVGTPLLLCLRLNEKAELSAGSVRSADVHLRPMALVFERHSEALMIPLTDTLGNCTN